MRTIGEHTNQADGSKLGSHTVKVFGEACEVEVIKTAKTVWRAIGTYRGKPYDAKGRSENTALKNWRWLTERLNDWG
jgi:hypothetical protein